MTTYTRTPGVKWVVDRTAVVVSNGRGAVHHITYPEAAVWDFVSRGYPFARVVALTASVAEVGGGDAEELVRRTLDEWVAAGLLARSPA